VERADELAIMDRRKRQGANRLDALTQPVGGALSPIRAEGGVEQLLDRLGGKFGKRHIVDQEGVNSIMVAHPVVEAAGARV
jgi:hypothetical protein